MLIRYANRTPRKKLGLYHGAIWNPESIFNAMYDLDNTCHVTGLKQAPSIMGSP